jgi:hypothetical protein
VADRVRFKLLKVMVAADGGRGVVLVFEGDDDKGKRHRYRSSHSIQPFHEQ